MNESLIVTNRAMSVYNIWKDGSIYYQTLQAIYQIALLTLIHLCIFIMYLEKVKVCGFIHSCLYMLGMALRAK